MRHKCVWTIFYSEWIGEVISLDIMYPLLYSGPFISSYGYRSLMEPCQIFVSFGIFLVFLLAHHILRFVLLASAWTSNLLSYYVSYIFMYKCCDFAFFESMVFHKLLPYLIRLIWYMCTLPSQNPTSRNVLDMFLLIYSLDQTKGFDWLSLEKGRGLHFSIWICISTTKFSLCIANVSWYQNFSQ